MLKILKKYLNVELLLIILLAIFEIFHVKILFQNANFLAGGDNYTFLQLGRQGFYPYVWDSNYISFGGISVSIPNLLGFPLYGYLLKFFTPPIMERIIIYLLYLFRYIGFIKLIKLLSKKISLFSLIPALFLFTFNAFESLNPFSLYSLMFSVYLPFSIYYFIKLHSSNKLDFFNISKLLILSAIFAPINANIPLGVAVFVPQFVYIIYQIRDIKKQTIINLFQYYLLLTFMNLWWFYPLIIYFLNSASDVFSNNWFSAVGAGDLSAYFRFIGQWGWYGGHFLYNYYPFNQYYDNFLVILVTYCITVFAFLGGSIKKSHDDFSHKFRLFFIILALFGLFLMGGSNAPFGYIYNLLYNNVFGLKMFREPFTKFGEIYVLAFCILFYFSLENLKRLLKDSLYTFPIFILIIFSVFIAVKPSLLGEHVWSKWNGSMRTFRVNIPDYWIEFENYTKNNIKDFRILTSPRILYGAAWSWPDGVSSADDIAINFIGNTNNLVRNPLPSVGGKGGSVLDNFFNDFNIPSNYLSLLGVDYILQENDLDWRYYPSTTYPPDKNTLFMQRLGLTEVAEFGEFSNSYLLTIPNSEPNVIIKDDLYSGLLNRPALILYKTPVDKVLPKIYVPKNVVYSTGKALNLPEMVNLYGSNVRTAYFLDLFRSEINRFTGSDILANSNSVALYPQRQTTRIDLNSFIWNTGWVLPNISVNPSSLEFELVKISENFDFLTIFDRLKKLDLLAWYSVKRVDEISKYNLTNEMKLQLVNRLLKDVDKGVNIINKISVDERNGKFWEAVQKFNAYAEKAFGSLSTFNIDLIKDTKALEVLTRLRNTMLSINGTSCGEYCFKLNVPEDGTYDLFVGDKFVESSYLNKDNSIQKQLNPTLFLKDMEVGEIQNFGNTNKFVQIKNWEDEKQYKISFDYKTNSGKLGFILIEEIPKKFDPNTIERKNTIKDLLYTFNTNIKNTSIIKNTKYCSLEEQDVCYTHYEKVVKAGKNAENVMILFEFSSNNFPIKNLKIQLITSPDVRLVKKTSGITTVLKIVPEIVFNRINPTKYTVHVSNARTPYFLVLNESYNNGWRVYKKDSNSIKPKEYIFIGWIGDIMRNILKNFDKQRKENLTTYFDDDITEIKGNYIFADSNTFSTWGRKNILANKHYVANGYANSWFVSPSDVGDSSDYDLVIEYWPQRIFYILLTFFVFILSVSVIYVVFYRFFPSKDRNHA